MSYTHNDQQNARDDLHALQEKVSEGRREFFKQVGQGAVATAVATTAMQMGVRPFMKPAVADSAAGAAMPHGGWKNLFSLKPNFLYMNIGTTGSTPTRILDKYEQWYYDVAWRAQAYQSNVNYCIDAVAGGAFGANPSEFVMSFTTTDGMMKMMEGQDWKAGDNLMITNMEHGGGLGPMYCMINRYGMNNPVMDLKWVDKFTGADVANGDAPNAIPAAMEKGMILVPTGIRATAADKFGYPLPDQLKATKSHPDRYFYSQMYSPQQKRLLNEKGKIAAMMVSSPPYLTGVRMPENYLCAYTAPKKIRSLIDGAHIPGMINVDFHSWGVDFFAGSGHKWQCGPGQTGIAYIRNGRVDGSDNGRAWSFSGRSGSASAYTLASGEGTVPNTSALPKYFPWSGSPRNSKFTDLAKTQRRQFFDGYRDPKQNASTVIQSIGNNSIPLNRALYECISLWNSIGRAAIENYVVTLAQYFRYLSAKNEDMRGDGAPGSQLYAHVQDFRKNQVAGSAMKWTDVWNPYRDSRVPVWVKCGLTTWNPMHLAGNGPDYNAPMTVAEATAQGTRSSALLTYLNSVHGMFARNTSVPHMMRFKTPANPDVIYAANTNNNYRPVGEGKSMINKSTPLRVSTHLFHDMGDIEEFAGVWSKDDVLKGMTKL